MPGRSLIDGLKEIRDASMTIRLRCPIVDMFKVVTTNKFPVDSDEGWVKQMLSRRKNDKRYVWFGWLADGVRRDYMALLSVVLMSKAAWDKERRKVFCPLCGLMMDVDTYARLSLEEVKRRGYRVLCVSEG